MGECDALLRNTTKEIVLRNDAAKVRAETGLTILVAVGEGDRLLE
jgi:hypothetical protein